MIVMGCFEVPGYGGAATTSYHRFAELQRRGLPVAYVNLIPAEHESFFHSTFGPSLGNPSGLRDVHNCWVQFPPFSDQADLGKLLASLQPQQLVGCGYIAAWLLHRMAPQLPLTFLTAGFRWAQDLISDGIFPDFISLRDHLRAYGSQGLPPFHARQREAFLACQRCLTHADMIGELYRLSFPNQQHKLHPRVLWMADISFAEAAAYGKLCRPFAERRLDLLFVASRWDRPEKNFPMLQAIASACPHLRVGIVGLCEQPPALCECFGMLTERAEVLKLLGDARVLVCPSIFDAAPGILYEGAAMGCNLVASQNCGNWSLPHPDLLVESFTAQGFVEKCGLAVCRPFPDQRHKFLAGSSQGELLQQLLELPLPVILQHKGSHSQRV